MRSPAAAALLAVSLLVTGCTGSDERRQTASSPREALAAAKQALDQTSGVHLTLSSTTLPGSVTGLVSADGVLTHAPAFQGTIVVQYAGFQPEVPVIAVGGKVYAQLPLTTTGYQQIDPSAYGAPDPAALADPATGLSSMLTATTDVTEGGSQRGGEGNKEVLTSYAGTLPESAVKVLLPSVAGDVAATYTLTDDDQLRQAVLEGDFYGTGDTETYTVTVDDYGTDKHISAP